MLPVCFYSWLSLVSCVGPGWRCGVERQGYPKELAGLGWGRCSCSEMESMKARCVRVPLPSAVGRICSPVAYCVYSIGRMLRCVVHYLQVTMILCRSKMPRHKCVVVCDGIDSANRVSLISVHTSAESSLSHSVLRENPLICFSSRVLCTCPLLGSSALCFPSSLLNIIILMRLLTLKTYGIFSPSFVAALPCAAGCAQPVMVVIAAVLLLGWSCPFRAGRLLRTFTCGDFVCTCAQRFSGVTMSSSAWVQW